MTAPLPLPSASYQRGRHQGLGKAVALAPHKLSRLRSHIGSSPRGRSAGGRGAGHRPGCAVLLNTDRTQNRRGISRRLKRPCRAGVVPEAAAVMTGSSRGQGAAGAVRRGRFKAPPRGVRPERLRPCRISWYHQRPRFRKMVMPCAVCDHASPPGIPSDEGFQALYHFGRAGY